MPVLQVKCSEEELELLRGLACEHGCTQTEVVRRWLRGLRASNGRSNAQGNGLSNGLSNGPSDSTGLELIELGRQQVELLRRLVTLQEGVVVSAPEGTPMGGDEVGGVEEGAAGDGPQKPSVSTPAVDVEATPAENDLEARVEAMEELDRLLEDWLAGIRAGGDPVAPPLSADASEADWVSAAEACLKARGREALPALVAAVLSHWGRD